MNYDTLASVCGSNGLANINTLMNLLQKYQLKIIFSLKDQLPGHEAHPDSLMTWDGAKGLLPVAEKAVRTFKNYPALLAWYVSDEEVRRDVPNIVQLREAISRIDPNHPTWTLTCHIDDLPYYGISGDVVGVDPYPIEPDRQKQSIKDVITSMQAANRTGLPCWVVPQMFNWAMHRSIWSTEVWKKSRGPNAEEMRAMPLLAAIYGAKGFVFFAYLDLVRNNDAVMPGSGTKEWNEKVVPMTKVLRELEPFIMSIVPAPAVKVESNPKDEVHARAMVDEKGNLRILIVGTGLPCKAIITVPNAPDLKSQFGKTRLLGGGRYEFVAHAVESDILYNDPIIKR
jgi:hypothetical protein